MMKLKLRKIIAPFFWLLTITSILFLYPSNTYAITCNCKAWLVQSIPSEMPQLRHVPGVLSTAEVFQWIAGNATHKLDIIAQYWQLVPSPDNPQSGDYGYKPEAMLRFGANRGLDVYKALKAAAVRNVSIRLLQHSGLFPDYTKEPDDLASGRSNVKSKTLLFDKWWGSGIVHAKVWTSDHRNVYIGSANNDWKSLTQVKELGVYLVDCPKIARKVEEYADNLWDLAALDASVYTRNVWDHQWQISRTVPCWSHFIESEKRCTPRIPRSVETPHAVGYPALVHPRMIPLQLCTPGCGYSDPQPGLSYLSFSPPELSFDTFPSDEQAWVDTIKSVSRGGTVRISTMDWLSQSQYTKDIVFWPALSSAVSEVVFSKHATVKILVAYWAHFIKNTDEYLKSLLYTNVLCSSSQYNQCSGKIEIKYYIVPGFNATGPAIQGRMMTGNIYPDYTRVNHGKYAVSDLRAHIGTSNLAWDYFYTTAGVSFGTYNAALVSQLQSVFDADWESPYTVPVSEYGPLDDK